VKTDFFVKCHFKINQITGSQGATAVLCSLEYWFKKKPGGFYKFMEPCSHKLYREGDSFVECLGVSRKSFWRSFKSIGIKYNSRTDFENSTDKFQGKMYASYYDRYSNRIFFIRNHEIVDKLLKPYIKPTKQPSPEKISPLIKEPLIFEDKMPFGNGHNGRSYIEAKNTSDDLSKDKSHASNEIVKKMIDIWTAIVGEGKEQLIELRGKIVPFLKKAFTDKFDNCLQQWKEYCKRIARSKFLMGEKTTFKATLEWALKFDIIAKILSGDHYGIGDRSRKLTPEELEELEREREEQRKAKELEKQRSLQVLEEEIKNDSTEPDSIKSFRIKWLNTHGEQSYREFLADSTLKVSSEKTDLIIQPRERRTAIRMESHWNPEILSGLPFKRVQLYHSTPGFMGKGNPIIFDRWLGEIEEPQKAAQEAEGGIISTNGCDESTDAPQDTETTQLRTRLKAYIPAKEYPAWLDDIKAQIINPDGILLVTFKDQLTSNYARIRFSEQILKSAGELWREVTGLMICEESDDLANHDEDECSEFDEKSLLQQAIQSLMGSGWGQGRGVLNDHVPY